MPRTLALVVPPVAAGARVDLALARLAPDLSRSRVRQLIHAGQVKVEGRPARAAARVRGGERVEVTLPDPETSGILAEDLPLTVLYQDDDLLVLDKAAGMVVHPARGNLRSTLVNALLHRFAAGCPGDAPGGGRLGLVHRLDKDTSGCLVVARTDAALAALQEAFRRREVEKTYLALCHGVPAAEGRLDTPYGRHPRDRKRFTGREEGTRRAVTGWRLREAFPVRPGAAGGAALLEVELHTGRTHQIRVHLSEAGHPLLADAVYGGTRREARLPAEDPLRRAATACGRQALHAWRLAFPHPRTGERVAFEAPWPASLAAAVGILRAASAAAGDGPGVPARRHRSPRGQSR